MPKLIGLRRLPRPDLLLACLITSFAFFLIAMVWSAPKLLSAQPATVSQAPQSIQSTQGGLSAQNQANSSETVASPVPADAVDISILDQPPTLQLIASRTPATPRDRIIRAGLSTASGPIQIWVEGGATVTDALQPGRELKVAGGDTLVFTHEAETSFVSAGRTYRGPIQIRTGSGVFRSWRAPYIKVSGAPARVTTNGNNPRWGRPYRGDLEVSEQKYSFEPAKHLGPLSLVNVVPLEQYLMGVVPWEMSPSAPFEALKAQAICARSETLSKIETGRHAKDGYDICDYDHCQGYPGTENEKPESSRAVAVTRGIAIFYGGKVADAVYGTNSGGITAGSGDVWRGTPPAYLQSVYDFSPQLHPATAKIVKPNMTEADWLQYCSQNLPSFAQPSQAEIDALAARRARSQHAATLFQPGDLPEFYRWTRTFSTQDLATAVSRVTPMKEATGMIVLERAASGHIKRLQVRGVNGSGEEVSATFEGDSQIRAMLSGRLGSTTALPSSTFVPIAQRDAAGKVSGFVFKGAGWGHSVGMCQRGAQNRAKSGWGARQILHHYYSGIQLLQIS